jgi:hypothetical protein
MADNRDLVDGSTEPIPTDVESIFRNYDRNKTDFLEVEELREFMADMSLIATNAGRFTPNASDQVIATLRANDTDGDFKLSLEEFAAYYATAMAPSVAEGLATTHPRKAAALRKAFRDFATFGLRGERKDAPPQLGSAQWMKLCRETGLVGRQALTAADADLIFAKVKPKGATRLAWSDFVDALCEVAKRRGMPFLDVVAQVAGGEGPAVNTAPCVAAAAASAAAIRLRPGSCGSDKSNKSGNSVDGSDADIITPSPHGFAIGAFYDSNINGQNTAAHDDGTEPYQQQASGAGLQSQEKHATATSIPTSPNRSSVSPEIMERVAAIYGQFAGFGTGSGVAATQLSPLQREMDSKQFAKLCRESGISRGPVDSPAVDLAFAKVRVAGRRRLSFAEFLTALELLAKDRKLPEGEALARVASCTGPRRNSTTPEYTRLHDDKDTYTGVYSRGGPRVSDASVADIAKLLSRDGGRRTST